MAAYAITQSTTTWSLVFFMTDSADHITGKTGLTVTVTLSKNGGAFGAAAGAVSEISSGWYKVAGNATDTNTLGPLLLHATASGADPTDVVFEVVAYAPQDAVRLGLTALPNAAAEAAGGIVTRGTGTGQLSVSSGQVILQTGTGTGQLDFTSGVVKANATQLLGTAWLTPGTAGTPDVNVKLWNALSTVALPLVPTVAGRTLDVSAAGEAGVDWANVGSPTTSLALTGTTIATTQKVDIETIKTNPVVNAGTVTFPTTATLASTTNITAGTITTVTTTTTATNVTTVNGLAAGVITATSIAADAITAAKIADNAIDRATFAADTGLQTVRSNTAAGGGASTITLDASASAVDNFYRGCLVYLTGATGVGQYRLIASYVGSTKVATVTPAWVTNPDNTSTFAIIPEGMADVEAVLSTASVGTAGYVGVDWGQLTNKTTTNALTGTTIASTQKVDVDTIKTNPVANGGTVTFPTNATLASTTNITAGTITTVTTVTNQLTAAAIATGVWQDTTAGDFTTAGSIGKSLFTSGAVPGATGGLFIAGTNAATVVTTSFTTTFTGNLTGNVGGSVASVTAAVTLAAKDSPAVATGTATAGGASTLTDSGAGWTTNLYGGGRVKLTSGTGAGQERVILSHTGTVLTVDRAWTTSPDNTSVYAILYGEQPALSSGLKVTGVVLTDACTTNTDMLTAAGVWAAGTRTLSTLAGLTVDTVTTLTNLPAITTDWITAAGVSAAAVTKVQSGLALAATALSTATWTNTLATNLTTLASHDPGATLGTSTLTAAGVWDLATSGHTTSGTFGAAAVAAGGAGDPWSTSLPGSYGAGTAGYIVGNNLDVAVGSRSTYDGSDTAGTTTLLTRVTGAVALASTALSTAQWTNSLATNLGTLAGHDPGATLGTSTLTAAGVWDLATSGHTTSGTFGAAMSAAGSAGDPWTTSLPGAYGAGTAGYIIGHGGTDPLASTVPGAYAQDTAGWVLGQLLSAEITFTGPVSPATGAVTLVRGDDYLSADGRALTWDLPAGGGTPDLSGAAVVLRLYPASSDTAALTLSAAVSGAGTAGQALSADLTAAQTAALAAGRYAAVLVATLADASVVTLARTACTVERPRG